ncbi:FAD/NAD(P)-binding domain-containing protein [Athelia psychrophila]|uniref:FAD/NAD(P)-binding domain-containing protein n=1 Tax=Athelia psychrophila TaxID=1759441 RepID=A0A165Z741_9AGAM|nr:FAD/NAD(P)-binding domain-containing protein [Fibularhizoctonia sp. CBS 109695]
MPSKPYGTDPRDIYTLLDEKCGIKGHRREPRPKAEHRIAVKKVAIIGAGISGLYTAMILQSLDIPFKIIEASNRTGGRILTHRFSNDPAQYYDVGAMRFPLGLPLMSRLKKLFERADIAPHITLIPYKFHSDNNMHYLHYNGVLTRKMNLPIALGDHFGFGVPPAYHAAATGYDRIVKDVRTPYVTALANEMANGGHEGWDLLMTQDRFSTRAFMAVQAPGFMAVQPPGFPNHVINWCETMEGPTGDYDRAFSRTVLGAMAFGATDPPPVLPNWTCIDGGSSGIINAMLEALHLPLNPPADPPPPAHPLAHIVYNTPVTAIGLTPPVPGLPPVPATMTVGYYGGVFEPFSHVISTIPLPVLRTMDISKNNLTVDQRLALRQLRYGHSVKIGVQFRSRWWENKFDNSDPPQPVGIVGGQSSTDMPIRTVVYPSYGLDRLATEPAVLIASYCRTEDAERLAALIVQFNSTPLDPNPDINPLAFNPDEPLRNPLASLVLRNLAELHKVDVDFLAMEVMAIHPWDWNAAPYAMGASAFFGPSDYDELKHLREPAAGGRLHFAGDAISTRHASVSSHILVIKKCSL